MKHRYMLLVLTMAVLILALAFGPRPEIDETVHFNPSELGPDLDRYLRDSEAQIANIKPGAEKGIIWNSDTGQKTERSIVYLHGFSATRRETSPLTENLAARLKANAFFTRLTGHGRDGTAMAQASMNDWINDTAEAIAIGERLGNRIVLIGASTGSTLATWAAARPSLMAKVETLILISPNFAVKGASIGLLNMPWGETLLPLVMGRTRSFETHNEAHAQWWTTSYPSRAVFPMGALLKAADRIGYEQINIPTMFIYAPDDQVIETAAVQHVIGRWGGPTKVVQVTGSDDPSRHVIAGDILSPSTTDRLVDQIADWVQSLN